MRLARFAPSLSISISDGFASLSNHRLKETSRLSIKRTSIFACVLEQLRVRLPREEKPLRDEYRTVESFDHAACPISHPSSTLTVQIPIIPTVRGLLETSRLARLTRAIVALLPG
jgi:hypothetical protein